MATQNSLGMPGNEGYHYCINGTNVTFPCKPYPSQLAVMNKILKGLARRENCLIESPTGSGKSLALLCSCLAWQRSIIEENRRIEEEMSHYELNRELTESMDSQEFGESSFAGPVEHKRMKTKGVHYINETTTLSPRNCKNKEQVFSDFGGDDDDFQMPKNSHKKKSIGSCSRNNTILKVKTPQNVHELVIDVPTADPNHVVTNSPLKASLSEITPVSSLHDSTTAESSNLCQTSEMKDFSPSKAGINYADGSICEYPASPLRTCSAWSSSSSSFTPIPSTVTCFNNLYGVWGINFSDNSAFAASGSSLQETEKTCPTVNDMQFPLKRVPQIYFGTRTHKQITQIVQELKKTVYRNVRMCILSSRERTCIHKTVSKSKNINNDCMELIELQGAGCHYFPSARNVTQGVLTKKGLNNCWDLEDLVRLGRKLKFCPYYSIRNLMNAEIIFCPYNYLIDPGIREKMNITLENNVIVLDEAHNIEDSAREAASFTVTSDELQDALHDISKLGHHGFNTYSHGVASSVMTGLLDWINKYVDNLTDFSDFDKSGKVWSGEELVAVLSEIKAGPDEFNYIQKHFNVVTSDERNEDPTKTKKPKLNASTTSLLENLLRIFQSLYAGKLKYMQDYRAVVTKEFGNKPSSSMKTGFVSKMVKGWIYSLNFLCLNPGVAFSSIKNDIHSLIVASGTLSPMKTFQSELNMLFPLSLEANHVISPHQVWIGSVGCGPAGKPLRAVYQQIDTFAFQDDLGELVLHVCQIVPYGVLCFFPSYGALEKITGRWQLTGLWKKLETHKIIVCEPRKNGEKTFEEIIHDYYDIIADEQTNGALFFAVYRGKVSEGLDFADNNARAVISIGIPFPSYKDIQVDLKRKYNNKFHRERQLMTGSEWYESRAFRALNQALGRCIRHRKDWGALILVDDRFREKRNITGLSKWIRSYIVHYDKFDPAIKSLDDFIKNQQFMESQMPHLLSESIIERPSSPSLFE